MSVGASKAVGVGRAVAWAGRAPMALARMAPAGAAL
jgi:hypothetical protein